jgi:hypothetical protein
MEGNTPSIFFRHIITPVMALTKEILAILTPDSEKVINYSHRTDNEQVASRIIETGFKFTESFYKTTDIVIDDTVNINYWRILRKAYGKYVVIISFEKALLERYEEVLMEKLDMNIFEVQQILTEEEPEKDENGEEVYTLSRHYIKGFFNEETEKIVYNPHFDPGYDSPLFNANIDRLARSY